MAIRATITVVRASADTKHISLSAKTTNVNAEAIAFVNPDSKNQWFYEVATLSDVQFSLVEKNLSETVTLDEVVGWSYAKNAPETLALVESFAKVVSFNRAFNDAFTLDDLSQIDKDFYGNKGNVAFMLDIIGLTYHKDFTNKNQLNLGTLNSGELNDDGSEDDRRVTVSDVVTLAIDWVRTFTDSYSVTDANSYALDKAPSEEVSVIDTTSKEVSSSKTETVTATDEILVYSNLGKLENISLAETYAKGLVKRIEDAFTLDDSALINKDFTGNKGNIFGFSDLLGNNFGKALTDSISQLDEVSILQGLNKSDSTTLSDTYRTTLNKAISDAFTLDDALQVDKDYFGNKGNVFTFSDVLSYEASKDLTDGIALVELVGFILNHPVEDSYTVTDTNTLQPELVKSESIGFSDTYIRNIMKGLSDGFALDDSAQVNKDVDSTKGNIFSFSDVFSRTVSYDRAYTDSFGFSDNFSRTVGYVRAYSDSYSVSDTRDVHLNKTLVDTFTLYDDFNTPLNSLGLNESLLNGSGDRVVTDLELGRPESLTFNELTAFVHSKRLNNLTTLEDVYGLQLEKTFTDGFALDDSALIDKDYFGNKGNIVGVSDQVTVDYYYGGLVGQRPLNTMSLN